ncbi:MAG: acyl-CoA dehydrogenase family protein, partial [Pseudomonadota bacterium]
MSKNTTPYAISDETRMMLDSVRRFRLQELEPIWQQVDEEDRIPEPVVQKMRELGLFGMATPKEYGGLGLTALEEALVQEELSQSSACFRSRIAGTNGIGCQGMVIDGTPEQKAKYLPHLASGEWTAAFAMTEPNAGSDAASIQTKAELKGDHWVLNGTKQFITNGPSANLFTVMAVTDPAKRTRGGITAFLVEATFPGLKRGAVDSGMGLRGNPTCQIILDDCIVPRENVIGGDKMIGNGFKTAMRIMDKGRLFIAAHALGGAQRCLELSVAYAKTREQFGQPIGNFQMIQAM